MSFPTLLNLLALQLKRSKCDISARLSNYDDNKVTPNYEEFDFAANAHGSGFIVGKTVDVK